jgi:hypothetical protein
MNTRHRRSSLWSAWFVGTAVSCLCAAALGLPATVSAQPADQAGDQGASWQSHKMDFNYLGFTPTYSCIGLRDDLEFLLQQSGARMDAPVMTMSCFRGDGAPSKLISARLRFSTLQPVAAGAEDTTDAPGSATAGSWRHVEFSNTRSVPQLGSADCELVLEFKDQILKSFNTRNLKSYLPCVPYQTTGAQWSLSFDVFVPSSAPPRSIGGAD